MGEPELARVGRCTDAGWVRALIPLDKLLAHAGMLPPLDVPHHLRADEWHTYREGIILPSTGPGSLVDVGLDKVRTSAAHLLMSGPVTTGHVTRKGSNCMYAGYDMISHRRMKSGKSQSPSLNRRQHAPW